MCSCGGLCSAPSDGNRGGLIEEHTHQRPGAGVSRLRAANSITALTCSRLRPSNHSMMLSRLAPASRDSRKSRQRALGVLQHPRAADLARHALHGWAPGPIQCGRGRSPYRSGRPRSTLPVLGQSAPPGRPTSFQAPGSADDHVFSLGVRPGSVNFQTPSTSGHPPRRARWFRA